ncbi:Myosin phosphatase Rho-interacting protein [Bagarius yarrelli]|uniref:Myosin phosphatase Rho-interacting protein n=1 Tax=Bagarius yarrelli TaxID=175774 RepID=A0A556TIM6_BAGYA|nr:Myosin phosphatase Rho-interacting protein [Bagarius yarrelli]
MSELLQAAGAASADRPRPQPAIFGSVAAQLSSRQNPSDFSSPQDIPHAVPYLCFIKEAATRKFVCFRGVIGAACAQEHVHFAKPNECLHQLKHFKGIACFCQGLQRALKKSISRFLTGAPRCFNLSIRCRRPSSSREQDCGLWEVLGEGELVKGSVGWESGVPSLSPPQRSLPLHKQQQSVPKKKKGNWWAERGGTCTGKPRRVHPGAKPIYGGWLCLAPEGTDFDNPMQRSRKWQRRFFVLYEHGCLRFALDESPSTLPQGTVNMNLCTDVIDAEPKTGQKNALCIITPEQEYYIRGDSKEIINGWSEQLVIYPRTNKQNQKKKRKVEPTTSQEPGPAKVAVTGSGIPDAEKVPDSSSIIWQEELQSREAEVSQAWSSTDLTPQGSLLTPAEETPASRGSDLGSVNGDEVDRCVFSFSPCLSQPPQDLVSPTAGMLGGVPRCPSPAHSEPFPSGSSLLSNGSHISGSISSLDSDASTDSHVLVRGRSKPEKRRDRMDRETVLSPERSGRSNVIEKLEALELENSERMEIEEVVRGEARQGRSEMRRFNRQDQKLETGQSLDFHHATLPPLRRAKSLDRRTTESVMTPDLLNFKKGWMVKLDEQGQWKKYWFVLTDHSLRYYKDSIAEEASDLDGEIDLSTCYNVTEYQAQRNYGFQIHTQEGVHTLSAMTAGIRRNWIQAVMKNVRPSTAPDVTSLTDEHGPFGPLENLTRPDVTQDSPSSEASSVEREPRKSRARERRREGRSKTFDWAEFRPIAQALAQQRAHEADALQAQLSDSERSKRREERRRRYECVTGSMSFDQCPSNSSRVDSESMRTNLGSVCPPSPDHQQKVIDEIEQHWQQVEKTPIREEKRVPLSMSLRTRETTELEKLLESYKKGVEDLRAQLETCHQQLSDSNQHKQELENQLKEALDREHQIRVGYISPLESPLSLEPKPQMKKPELVSSQAQSLTKTYQETKELLQLQELKKRNMQAQLGLSLSHSCTKEPSLSETKSSSTSEILASSLATKSVTFLLLDNEGKIRELEDLIDCSKPLSVKELIKLLHCHTDSVLHTYPEDANEHVVSGDIKCQKLLENLRNLQETENETIKKSLAKAGDSIRDYEARLITMEDMLERVHKTPCISQCHQDDSTQTSNRDLAQRVELLLSENEALNQQYQEIVNQLKAADREIDRLKVELQSGQQFQQSRVNQNTVKLEDEESVKNWYEQELLDKSQKLEEALIKLERLEYSLKDTEMKLQLKDATLKGLGFLVPENDNDCVSSASETDQLRCHIEVIESKLSEKEKLLQSVEKMCKDLRAQNTELRVKKQEAKQNFTQACLEATEDVTMLNARSMQEVQSDNERKVELIRSDESVMKEVLEGFKRRSNALNEVLAMLIKSSEDGFDKAIIGIEEGKVLGNLSERVMALSECEILSRVLSGFEKSQVGNGESDQAFVLKNLAERMLGESKILFFVLKNLESPVYTKHAEIRSDEDVLEDKKINNIMKHLVEIVQTKVNLLNQIALSIKEPANEEFKALMLTLSSCEPQTQWSRCVRDALLDVTHTYLLIQQRFQTENQRHLDFEASTGDCVACSQLKEQNLDLKLKLDQMSSPQNPVADDSKPVMCIHIEDKPIDSLDKTIQLQDMVAKHKKELRELREAYEREAVKQKEELSKSQETLRLRSEENVKEIDSLTVCMENLQKKHEVERNMLEEHFNQELATFNEVMGSLGEDFPDDGQLNAAFLKQRIQKLVARVTEETKLRDREGEATLLRLKYEKDLENLKATCERGFAAMEESHQKVIDELQRKHQRELENLQEEKERLLAEETAATIAAIEAMKNAHRTELEKELEKARKAHSNNENADVEEIRRQHEEELLSFQREIEVLSEQYSQKCLENAHLAQALEAERQALRQCQRENQELNAHNQELNNRLAAEITKMRSMASEEGESGTVIQGKELYELEVMLRVKESEVQYLKQEINSLKDELQAAQRDKKYATDKYKDIYTELSIVKAKAERDLGRLREQLQLAHKALGEPTPEEVQRGGYDIMKSKSNPDILKMAAAAAKRSERTMRSKSLKEGLTAEQRLHLFDNKDTKEF